MCLHSKLLHSWWDAWSYTIMTTVVDGHFHTIDYYVQKFT